MELVKLNSNFQPASLVENYESLIWTERYSTAGEFVLESENVAQMIAALSVKQDTFVSLRDSNVPMLVETHKIEKKKGQAAKLITTGRSVEAPLLERRSTVPKAAIGVAPGEWGITANSSSDLAYYVMNFLLEDPVTALAADIIPQLTFPEPDDWGDGTAESYVVERGKLYPWVLKQVVANKHALRTERPNASGNRMAVRVYKGVDRSTSVVFDARFDNFDDTTYLLSRKGFGNTAQVFGATDSLEVNVGGPYTGLDRFVEYVDAISDTDGVSPGPTLDEYLQNLGIVEIGNATKTEMFTGEISSQTAAKYGTDYYLGDTVKLVGEYGLTQNVTIAEFVRTSDATGEKSYPTFEAVT